MFILSALILIILTVIFAVSAVVSDKRYLVIASVVGFADALICLLWVLHTMYSLPTTTYTKLRTTDMAAYMYKCESAPYKLFDSCYVIKRMALKDTVKVENPKWVSVDEQ